MWQLLQRDIVREMSTNQRLILAALLAAAFVARLGVRLAFGEEYFWDNGYSFYYEMAENFISGKGLCSLELGCAARPPFYPMLLASTTLGAKNYLLIVAPQALMGSGTALCAFLIGRHIFNPTAGLIACGVAAFYPYYVMHDTALQETGMLTFFTALWVWLLLRASESKQDWVLAGLALGAIVLVRVTMAPFIGVALLWTASGGAQGNIVERLRKSAILLLPVIIMVAMWLGQTYRLTGAAVLSSESGLALWAGNNSETFSHYPADSMDESMAEARLKWTAADQAELQRLAGDEIAISNWFAHRALEFIRANPLLVVQGAFRKLGAAFSWRLNPPHDDDQASLAQAVYAIGYVPVALLGIFGMLLAWRRRETILIGMLFLAFMGVTAVFWSHTSHRSYLDVYWIVFAASVVEIILARPISRLF
jgi:4-amino-4-deoxy-L-arabinose transferase-like glycosyltransferase